MKIFHASDIHLGKKRLDGRLPDQDLADAFGFIADRAIEEEADAFLLAGDLFDRPQVEPQHLRQAQKILFRLKSAGIPVVAIEGNHDKALIHSDIPTWVRYLADDDLLYLLRPEFDENGAILGSWNPETKKGAMITIGGVRFIGAGYLGAATPNKVRQIVTELDDEYPNVLLLHAGPDYFVGEGGGFSDDDLLSLEEKICYLALGHIHKPMVHGNWACNPGSPENCDLREATYGKDIRGRDTGRGYAVVEISPTSPKAPLSLVLRNNPRRLCLKLELSCTPFGGKGKKRRENLVDAAVELIKETTASPASVVELRLIGVINLNQMALDPDELAVEIQEASGVFAVSIDPSGLNIPVSSSGPGDDDEEQMSREDLERKAISLLLEDDPLWNLEDKRQDFVELFFDLKEGVRHHDGPEKLAEKILQNPLIGEILKSEADRESGKNDGETLRVLPSSNDAPTDDAPSVPTRDENEIRRILGGQ